jgi:hypothetical protein
VTTCRTVRTAAVRAVLLLAVAFTGCGKGIPKTYPVNGIVVYKGGKPVTYGRVEFHSKSHPELRATGGIQTDGSFTLTTHLEGKNREGAVAGEHTVLIELESRAALVTLPDPYTVTSGDNTVTFEIPSRER